MQLNFIAVKTQIALNYASKIALLILRNNQGTISNSYHSVSHPGKSYSMIQYGAYQIKHIFKAVFQMLDCELIYIAF